MLAIIGTIYSLFTLALIPLIAYVCIILAIKNRNPSLYSVFFVFSVSRANPVETFVLILEKFAKIFSS